jgi:DNA-binding winged helix-turn-helix (wHTH) protein
MESLDPANAGSWRTGYRFGEYRLEADGTLLRGETPIPLEPRELAALRLLLAHRGRVVTLDQFNQALWGEEPVAAENVAGCLDSLRQRLEPYECIEAIAKRGYRFFADALPTGAETFPALPRLVILPFSAGYGVPEFLGSAIAEAAGERLGGMQPPVATVVARDSVFALARSGLEPRKIGELMKADLVLGGELRGVAAHYRLRAEMIGVEGGSQLWAEDLLVERSRIADLETELLNRVAPRLAGWGLSIAAAAVPAPTEPGHTPEQREAYELYARGRHEWQSLERHRMQDAVQHLLRAIELDPGLVQARVQFAHLCVSQVMGGFVPPQVASEMARRATAAAADVPPYSEAMLPSLGWISFHVERDLPAALRSFARSAHLPHDHAVTRARCLFALSRHRFGEAIEIQSAAIREDPYSAWLQGRLAWAYHLAGENSLSMKTALSAIEHFPGEEGPELYGAMVLAFNGESGMAVDVARDLTRRMPYYDPASAVEAYALAMAGRADEARLGLERLQWLRRERFSLNSFSPAAYVALGDHDTALAELRLADSLRCPWFFQMLADPQLRPLHTRPEYASMLDILAGMEADVERNPLSE